MCAFLIVSYRNGYRAFTPGHVIDVPVACRRGRSDRCDPSATIERLGTPGRPRSRSDDRDGDPLGV
ncbi:hypothetical protein BRC77_06520, partial [Halobacteriales archaeon QH_8_64_26]